MEQPETRYTRTIAASSHHRAFLKALIFTCALGISLLGASCGTGDRASSRGAKGADIVRQLRHPGKITHVRYTSYTPPWPTRSEAWIDWENDRVRSWNVQWTDNPTNPSVCTSIRDGDNWYPCLPSLDKLGETSAFADAFWPTIPLHAAGSTLSVRIPSTDRTESAPVQIGTQVTTKSESLGGIGFAISSWKVTSEFDATCEGDQPGEASFDYTATNDGEPISEFITVDCPEQSAYKYIGVVYHDVQFVDQSDLPPDFFDADAARTSLLGEELSAAAALLGTVFWLGQQVGDWTLGGAEHDVDSATVAYSRGDGRDQEVVELTTRVGRGTGYRCDNAEPIPSDSFSGSLCPGYRVTNEYRIVWNPPGFDLWLEKQSYPATIDRNDILALGRSLTQWEQHASGPLLSDEAVRDLVADSLELVCFGKLKDIREARSQSSFTFDRKTGEWTGVFGSFGEYAVPDSKPVAIPVSQRKEIESSLSHNAAQFADCGQGETPSP